MKDLKLTSQSIVFVADTVGVATKTNEISLDMNTLAFRDIANASYLTGMMKSIFEKKITYNSPTKDPNYPQSIFNFENGIQIVYDKIPTRLTITYNTDNNSIENIKKIYDYIMDTGEDVAIKTSAIGINFNFFAPEDKSKLKSIFNDTTKDSLIATKVVLQYDLLGFETNFTFADVIKDDINGIGVYVNFHKKIDNNIILNDILNQNFITTSLEKIDLLYPTND